MTVLIIKTVLILGLFSLGSFLLNLKVNYYLKKLNVTLTSEQSREMKWLVSSIVTILTALSYLLYLVLSY